MRKSIFIMSVIIFLGVKFYLTQAVQSMPYVSADGAVLMDATTGMILYSKNADTAYPPASTTKVMTALLTLENCKMDDIVTIGTKPTKVDGNNIALFEGETFTVKDMLYALINESANDCAEALAEHISGSVEEFSIRMNTRAKELGCKNTNFLNPSGLYQKNHKTTARDLALIMKELTKHEEFKEISTTMLYNIKPTNKTQKERVINNHNRLLVKNSGYYYEGCEGGKTGYTIQSKHSYVVCGAKDGRKLIVALIHDTQKTFYKDSITLFNYGFNNFQLKKAYSKGELISTHKKGEINVPLFAAEDFYYVKDLELEEEPKYIIEETQINSYLSQAKTTSLEALITLGGETIGKLNLMSPESYKVKAAALEEGTAKENKANSKGFESNKHSLRPLFLLIGGAISSLLVVVKINCFKS